MGDDHLIHLAKKSVSLCSYAREVDTKNCSNIQPKYITNSRESGDGLEAIYNLLAIRFVDGKKKDILHKYCKNSRKMQQNINQDVTNPQGQCTYLKKKIRKFIKIK